MDTANDAGSALAEPDTQETTPTEVPWEDKSVEENSGLVAVMVKRFAGAGAARGLTFDDLMSVGKDGLIKAKERFDKKKGFKFSTYANWWIRAAITRYLDTQPWRGVLRVPVGLQNDATKLEKTIKKLFVRLGRKPRYDELKRACVDHGSFTESVFKRAYMCVGVQAHSLQSTVHDGDSDMALFENYVPDTTVVTPDQEVNLRQLARIVHSGLAKLDDTSRLVVSMRYGLGTDDPRSFEEIGRAIGAGRNAATNLHNQALRKLRLFYVDERKPDDLPYERVGSDD